MSAEYMQIEEEHTDVGRWYWGVVAGLKKGFCQENQKHPCEFIQDEVQYEILPDRFAAYKILIESLGTIYEVNSPIEDRWPTASVETLRQSLLDSPSFDSRDEFRRWSDNAKSGLQRITESNKETEYADLLSQTSIRLDELVSYLDTRV